jgi:hypothetical protein
LLLIKFCRVLYYRFPFYTPNNMNFYYEILEGTQMEHLKVPVV